MWVCGCLGVWVKPLTNLAILVALVFTKSFYAGLISSKNFDDLVDGEGGENLVVIGGLDDDLVRPETRQETMRA